MITKAYFLIGSQYVRYDVASDQVDAGYPKPIGANWPGFSAAGVDTGVDAAGTVWERNRSPQRSSFGSNRLTVKFRVNCSVWLENCR